MDCALKREEIFISEVLVFQTFFLKKEQNIFKSCLWLFLTCIPVKWTKIGLV